MDLVRQADDVRQDGLHAIDDELHGDDQRERLRKGEEKEGEIHGDYIRSGAAMPRMSNPLAMVWRQAADSTRRAALRFSSAVTTRPTV